MEKASIIAAIEKIGKATLALNETVGSWDGGLLGALPIVAKSAVLLADIKSGDKVATKSKELTTAEALNLAVATQTLANDVNSTLDTIIAARPKFNDLLLSPITLLNLDLEQSATKEFSDAVVAKVPTALQSTAEALIKPIEAGFATAIDDYKGQL